MTAVFSDSDLKLADFLSFRCFNSSYRASSYGDFKEPTWLLPGWSAAPLDLWQRYKSAYIPFFSKPSNLDLLNDTNAAGIEPKEGTMDNNKLQNFSQSADNHPPAIVDDLMEEYFSIGRPFWYSLIRGCRQGNFEMRRYLSKKECTIVMDKAREKLALTTCLKKVNDSLSVLAVLNCRLGFSVSGCSVVASKLVADRMALNMYMGKDGKFLSIGYPYERMLMNASMYWMNNDKIPYLDQLQALVNSIMEGQVVFEHHGELISRLLLTWAFDCALRNFLPSGEYESFIDLNSITVYELLQSLYGDDAITALGNSCKIEGFEESRKAKLKSLLNGYVRIGKWIKLETALDYDSASYYFSLGVAMITVGKHSSCGKLIPVYLTDSDAFTWIFVEDRNCTDAIEAGMCTTRTSFASLFEKPPIHPYLILLFQFGAKHERDGVDLFEGFPDKTSSQEMENKFAIGLGKLRIQEFQYLREETAFAIEDKLEMLRSGKFKSEDKYKDFAQAFKNVSSKWQLNNENLASVKFS